MDQIKNEALNLLNMLLQSPDSSTERWISAVIAVFVLALVFLRIGDRMDLPNVGVPTSFLYTGLGLAIMVVGVGAARIYLPDLHAQTGNMVFNVVAAVVVSAAVVVPLINACINGKYMGTLTAWSISVVSAIVAIAFLVNIYAFIDGGGQALQRGADHNEATKEMLK